MVTNVDDLPCFTAFLFLYGPYSNLKFLILLLLVLYKRIDTLADVRVLQDDLHLHYYIQTVGEKRFLLYS